MADESALQDEVEANRMPLLDHLIELRRRLMYCMAAIVGLFVISYFLAPHIYGFLVQPLAEILAQRGGERRMIYTALHEAFFTYIKVAFFTAMFLGFPIIAIQVWKFVAPGLYRSEQRAFLPFLVATPVLFFIGGAMAYYVIFPLAWRFFIGFEIGGADAALPIQLEAKVDQYLSLVMQLIFAFGLCFELPVVLTLLARAGIVSADTLKEKRRYAIVIAFVCAAVLTPPDVISQVGLALPIIALYEVSIVAARLVERARRREAARQAG
jgi:sec-independent protein translocase protein TatC